MNNNPNKREIAGWLRDGITSLPARMTGKILRRSKTGKILLAEIENKNLQRWYVSRPYGLTDRGRGYYRSKVNSVMSGKVVAHNKLTDVFNIIFGRVFQAGNRLDKESEHGRHYLYSCDTDLRLGGIGSNFSLNDNVVVYAIPAQFGQENLLWEDITNDEIYKTDDTEV